MNYAPSKPGIEHLSAQSRGGGPLNSGFEDHPGIGRDPGCCARPKSLFCSGEGNTEEGDVENGAEPNGEVRERDLGRPNCGRRWPTGGPSVRRFGSKRASVASILFDMGDLPALSARDLLRVRTAGVLHMHIDRLIGFDSLRRVKIGREARIELVGPAGLGECMGHKLADYTWDLVDRCDTELLITVRELVVSESLS